MQKQNKTHTQTPTYTHTHTHTHTNRQTITSYSMTSSKNTGLVYTGRWNKDRIYFRFLDKVKMIIDI